MLGAIIGDIVGSTFEAENHRSPFFELFRLDARFTDDTVCTSAVADMLNIYGKNLNHEEISHKLRLWCCTYLNRGYGSMFQQWILNGINKPYQSYGNGALMRISPVPYYAVKNGLSLLDCIEMAKKITCITHNHEESLLAVSIYVEIIYEILKNKPGIEESKNLIKLILEKYNYKTPETILRYRVSIEFDLRCETSLLVALAGIYETNSFEDVLYQIVSVGGDSDTYAAIGGAIAEAIYGIPDYMHESIKRYFRDYDQDILKSMNILYS